MYDRKELQVMRKMGKVEEDCRKLAEAARRHEKDRPDNAVHARTCAAEWDRLAEKARRQGR